jgi:hypothetical protein
MNKKEINMGDKALAKMKRKHKKRKSKLSKQLSGRGFKVTSS